MAALGMSKPLLPVLEELHEEDRMSLYSAASPHKALERDTPDPSPDPSTTPAAEAKSSIDIDDEDQYDTDIEDQELILGDATEEQDNCTAEYKRSCSRLNINPESKVVLNLNTNSLELNHQGLGEDGAKALAKSLLRNTTVEQLKLEDNSITPLGVTFIADMLCDNIYITYLDLSHNDVGTYGSLALKEALLWNNTLLYLILKDCKIKDSDCLVLAEGVQTNETLVHLDLSHNELCEDGAMCLGNAIAINNCVEQLNLAWNHIRGKGGVQICKGLKRNYCLVKVDLSWNGLGYDGALSLGQALKTNKYMRELDVSSNRLTWNCAAVIATGLKDNYTLEVFKIGLNPLTMTGVLELLSAVNNKHSEVEYLSFEGIPINRKIAFIAEMIGEQRDFSITHGGVIDTDDVVGRKLLPQDDSLTRLMAFLNDRGIRPMDLFRSLEKDKDNLVSREQFISGLKKAQAPLETWEMVQIMEVLDKSEEGKINLRKLSSGFQEKNINNKKKDLRAKADARRKMREERKLLNPEMSTSAANSVRASSSNAGSLPSNSNNNSRRGSRLSVMISQNDLRRLSTVSAFGGRSGATTPKFGASANNPALASLVSSQQQENRQTEVTRKLNRLSLPSSNSH